MSLGDMSLSQTAEDIAKLDLSRCIKVQYHTLYKCGECVPRGDIVIKEQPFKKYSAPAVNVTDVSQLGRKDELISVDAPCRAGCPYEYDPQPH